MVIVTVSIMIMLINNDYVTPSLAKLLRFSARVTVHEKGHTAVTRSTAIMESERSYY